MSVPEDERSTIARWCAARVPAAERHRWRLGWAVHGDDVTLVERRAPAEPGARWSSAPLAQLRREGEGRWTLHRPGPGGTWRATTCGPDPVALLEDQAPA
jgi:hypothetical protein